METSKKKVWILKSWVSDPVVSGEGYWKNVKATTNEWEAEHWICPGDDPDMNHDYDDFEIEV